VVEERVPAKQTNHRMTTSASDIEWTPTSTDLKNTNFRNSKFKR
jgi:hypothetical protein